MGWKHSRPQEFWAFDVLDPESMVSSHFVGDWALLATHFLTLCWLMISLAVEDTRNGGLHGEWMTWFTHWSLVLLSLAGGLGLATQARHMWRCRGGRSRRGSGGGGGSAGGGAHVSRVAPAGSAAAGAGVAAKAAAGPGDVEASGGVEQSARWDALSIAYLLTMETAVIAAFFLDVYYWLVLIGIQGDHVAAPATYLKHAGNLGVAFLEVALTRMPIVSVHFQAVLAYGTAYLLFLWIYGNVSGIWRYGLNWYKLFTVVMHGAVPVFLCVFMLVWWGIALLRERIGLRLRQRHGEPSHASGPGGQRGLYGTHDPAAGPLQG